MGETVELHVPHRLAQLGIGNYWADPGARNEGGNKEASGIACIRLSGCLQAAQRHLQFSLPFAPNRAYFYSSVFSREHRQYHRGVA